MEVQSSELTNNYAEGHPGSRYYGGCEYADEVEQFAIDRAKELWGAKYVNVQSHSGPQTNMGVFLTVLNSGGKILSLGLIHDGHLDHGHLVNATGRTYEVEQYETDTEMGYVDCDQLVVKAEAFDPDITISGYSAYLREVERECVQAATDSVDVCHLADIAHITGLVAVGEYLSPVGTVDFVTGPTHKTIRSGRGGIITCDEKHVDDVDSAVFPGLQGGPMLHNITGKAVGFGEALTPGFEEYVLQAVDSAAALDEWLQGCGLELVSEGTDTHLVLVDPRPSYPDTTGEDAEAAFEEVGIVLNANTAPGESRLVFNPSGIRAGAPASTTRGLDEETCRAAADLIYETVDAPHDESVKGFIDQKVDELIAEYPLHDRPAIGSVRLEPSVLSMHLRPDSEG